MWNSIQDGSCCRECLKIARLKAEVDNNLIAASDMYRTNVAVILEQVNNVLEGLPKDPCLEDEYVDRIIINVPAPKGMEETYKDTKELIIISGSLAPEDCFCQGDTFNLLNDVQVEWLQQMLYNLNYPYPGKHPEELWHTHVKTCETCIETLELLV